MNGLLLDISNSFVCQFGTLNQTTLGANQYKVTFAISFPKYILSVVASKKDLNNTSQGFWGLRLREWTAYDFTVCPDSAYGVFYIAIGA